LNQVAAANPSRGGLQPPITRIAQLQKKRKIIHANRAIRCSKTLGSNSALFHFGLDKAPAFLAKDGLGDGENQQLHERPEMTFPESRLRSPRRPTARKEIREGQKQ
jgi:hypothetical protein